MRTTKNIGRIVGLLLVMQLVGLTAPFVMLHPLTHSSSAFLAGAAASAVQIQAAVVLLLANGALTIGIALAALPLLRPHSPAMALLLVAVSVIWFTLQAVDNAHLLTMLSLSRHYAEAGGQEDLFKVLGVLVRAARRWVHYTELVVIDGWMFVLYAGLFRFGLVPRALAGFGLITVILHYAAITLPLFLGHRPVTPIGATMGLSQLALAGWLMAGGLRERPRPAGAETGGTI